MGAVQSIDIPPVSVPTDAPHADDETPIYRNIHVFKENGGQLISTFRSQPEANTIIKLLEGSSVKFADLDCTGEREKFPDGTWGNRYIYISYKEFFRRVLAFGRALADMGLKRGDRIGIYSHNSQWWQIAAFGAYSVGLVIVPVYDSLGPTAAQYIINHADVKVLLTSEFKYPAAVGILDELPNLKHIVVMGQVPSEPAITKEGISVTTCDELLKKGEESTTPNEYSQPDDPAVIMYTSGSTGTPKGCVLTQSNVVAGSAGLGVVNRSATPKNTCLSFLPLAHIYAMSVELMMYAQGVRVGFARGPISMLMDDIKIMQPTFMIVVPRVLNRVVDAMKEQLSHKPPYLQKLIYAAIKDKANKVKQNTPHSLLVDAIFFSKFREALGGKIDLIVSGGAPILPEVFEFLSAAVTPNIIQGYGLTEVSAGLAVQEMPVTNPLTVGACSVACEVKLKAVPGTDYGPHTNPPTGELLVRGPIVFREYYKQPELTAEALEGGWFHTGDVCEMTKEMQLRIIDRAKQIVKLSQGEYISLTYLTDLYSMAPSLDYIYIYADSHHGRPIAVGTFSKKAKEAWAAKGVTDICNDERVIKSVLDELLEIFTKNKMRGFEKIEQIILDDIEPTMENGLLTPSMKQQFASWRKRYEARIQEIYQ